MLKAKYLKESAKAYFGGMLDGLKSSIKVMIPVSAGIVILGAIALQAADEDLDEDSEKSEKTPEEESIKEDASVEATCENENFEEREKSWFKEE